MAKFVEDDASVHAAIGRQVVNMSTHVMVVTDVRVTSVSMVLSKNNNICSEFEFDNMLLLEMNQVETCPDIGYRISGRRISPILSDISLVFGQKY